MDIKIKVEPVDIEWGNEPTTSLRIKEESELVIDDGQWPATSFDDDNEYKDFLDGCNQIYVKSEDGLEGYTIQYLDESYDHISDELQSDDDYESDDSLESENYDINVDSDENDDTSENLTKNYLEVFNNSKEFRKECPMDLKDQVEINKWITANYVEYECPVCNIRLGNLRELRGHIEESHKKLIEDTEKNFFIDNDNCGVCQKCNKEFSTKSSRFLHSIKHNANEAKLEVNKCKVCGFKTKSLFIQKHILEKHPEILKEFKISGTVKNMMCPICSCNCKDRKLLWYHFMAKHPYYHKAKLSYSCHLCSYETFSEEDHFLQHLIDKHELSSWKILNYRKVIKNKEYIACLECNNLFSNNDVLKLLKHFLKHENNCYWSCKFCYKKHRFNKTPLRHMCIKFIQYCKVNYDKTNFDKIGKDQEKMEWKIKNMQEFEEYILHVCPFCNEEFSRRQNWQLHLRKTHAIETLKGLEMKIIANDRTKLCCVICNTVVTNKLHAHRFQHLPYKPYKCLLCSIPLSTLEMAVNHILKRCKDEEDRSFNKNMLVCKVDDQISDFRSLLEMQCSLCNCKKFYDMKDAFKHYEEDHKNFEDFFDKNSDGSMTCKTCYKQYVQYEKNSCFLHLHNHFNEKTFKCSLCLQSYATFKSVYQHLISRHNAKPLYRQSNDKHAQKTCEKNDSSAAFVPQLAMSTIKSHVLNEFAEFINYVCPECNEGMTTQQNWHTHITTQHNFFDQSNMYFKDLDGCLKCTTCKIKLESRTTQQQKHKLTHMPHKSFMCNLCYARCNSLGVLYGHFRRRHFAKGSFDCPICPEVSQTSYQRREHLMQKHPRTEWPDTLCSICYTILSSRSSLKKHMDTHDADRFKYTCDICGSKVLELKDYKLHMERHKRRGEVSGKICHNKYLQYPSESILSNNDGIGQNSQKSFIKSEKTENKTQFVSKIHQSNDADEGIDQYKYLKDCESNINKRKFFVNPLSTKKTKS